MAFFFVACSDDESDFATRPSGGESSSSAKSSSSSEYERVQCNVKTDENCIKDDRDGQTYKTVKIGDQVWMAENLNFKTDSSFCYKNTAEYCEKYGRLYRWAAAVGKSESECGYGYTCSLPSGNIQGVCPNGWHLPSKAEWETLFNAVGGQSTAGKVLKSTSGWNSGGNGMDAFGFSALPAGIRNSIGGFSSEGGSADFWSSTEGDSYYAYGMYLYYLNDIAYLDYYDKDVGFSVRCIQD
ncbi:fibrobacter succinogenes major paralogous domain-containing protein [Fibrobacter sp. UWP2]|uniref:fibrobacter succinogenes major paralogous domain-containing protein n=1 Tax=Fibrobacter sp. UWP2 TaxID=1896216 RepID=UPI001F35627B|nr:fibrobacter succinogenes major paralogous domain-containing protein [Fibrobacter sp. UWP2]